MSDAPAVTVRTRARAPGVDRLLCASVWLVPSFGRYLFRELFRPGLCASAPAYGIDLVLLAQHTRAARRHRAGMIGLAVSSVVFALVTVVGGGRPSRAALTVLGVPLLMFVLVGVHLYVIRGRASRILNDHEPPGAGLLPLHPAVERRLRASSDQNVVVFRGGAPFAGAGRPVERWKVRLDTTRAAVPARAEQLQKRLTLAIRAADIADLEVHNRLLVSGHHAAMVDGLLPDPYDPPLTRLEPGEIRRRIDGGTEFARTYLCVEKDSWQGELVVNAFIRVVLLAGSLFVDFYASVLLPPHSDIAAAERLPVSAAGRLPGVMRDAGQLTVRLVRRSPQWIWEVGRWRWRLWQRPARQRSLIRQMPSFDYGAGDSIRARVAAVRHEWMFAYEDEDMFVQAIRGLVLSTLTEYAHEHGIDTAELERQQTQIFARSCRIGDIQDRTVVHGGPPMSDDFAVWADRDWYDARVDHDDMFEEGPR